MCHRRTLNNKINRILEQPLRIIYSDYKFKEFLERNYSFTVHEKNMQFPAIEAYKVKNGFPSVIMNGVFQFGKKSAY